MKYILLFLILMSIAYAACEGCLLNNECIEAGVQRLTEENGYEVYCGADKIIYQAKNNKESCLDDYECLSYYCQNGICKEGKASSNLVKFFGIVILIFIVLLIGYFMYRKKKSRKIIINKISIRKDLLKKIVIRKKRIDPLEKGLKESFESLSSIFKKR